MQKRFKGPFYQYWTDDDNQKGKKGFYETMEEIIKYINENEPFDGLFAFSQGTIICKILLNLHRLKSRFTQLTVDSPKFGIFFSPLNYYLNIPNHNDDFNDLNNTLNVDIEVPIFNCYGVQEPKYTTVCK